MEIKETIWKISIIIIIIIANKIFQEWEKNAKNSSIFIYIFFQSIVYLNKPFQPPTLSQNISSFLIKIKKNKIKKNEKNSYIILAEKNTHTINIIAKT